MSSAQLAKLTEKEESLKRDLKRFMSARADARKAMKEAEANGREIDATMRRLENPPATYWKDTEIAKSRKRIREFTGVLTGLRRKIRERKRREAKVLGEPKPKQPLESYNDDTTLSLQKRLDQVTKNKKKIDWASSFAEKKAKFTSSRTQVRSHDKNIRETRKLLETVTELKDLEEWRDRYIAYAEEHLEESDDEELCSYDQLRDLIKRCNEHRQEWLVNEGDDGYGTNLDTRCCEHYRYQECPMEDYETSVWRCDGLHDCGGCHGVWTGYAMKCGCGVSWYLDTDNCNFAGVRGFNIESDEPCGSLMIC
jgi:chromosome segregation ATPase